MSFSITLGVRREVIINTSVNLISTSLFLENTREDAQLSKFDKPTVGLFHSGYHPVFQRWQIVRGQVVILQQRGH